MEPELFWGLFTMTGKPLAYMLYRSAEREEEQAEADRPEAES